MPLKILLMTISLLLSGCGTIEIINHDDEIINNNSTADIKSVVITSDIMDTEFVAMEEKTIVTSIKKPPYVLAAHTETLEVVSNPIKTSSPNFISTITTTTEEEVNPKTGEITHIKKTTVIEERSLLDQLILLLSFLSALGAAIFAFRKQLIILLKPLRNSS